MGETEDGDVRCVQAEGAIRRAKRLLVCMRYGIGDVVMETPALDVLKTVACNATITAIGAEPALQLVQADPAVDRVIGVSRWRFHDWCDKGTTEDTTAFRYWLSKEDFDVILDVSHAVEAVRDSIWQYGRADLFDTDFQASADALRMGHDGVSAIQQGVERGWGIRPSRWGTPRIRLSDDDREYAASFPGLDVDEVSPVIALSMEASSRLKKMPLVFYAELADLLISRLNATILLIAAPGGRDHFDLLWESSYPERMSVVSTTRLRRLAALLERCSALVCNDTGIMHMGAAMGAPVAAFFGPTSPAVYLPRHGQSVALGGFTQPCGYRHEEIFGPPLCICKNECLIGKEIGCISQTSSTEAFRAVESLISIAARKESCDARTARALESSEQAARS